MDFETLVNRHKDAVYRQMLRVCGNREDAEDVLIDALLRAWRHMDQLEDSKSFRGWLGSIARRVCWRLRNREALLPLLQLSALPQGGEEIAAQTAEAESQLDAARMKGLLDRAVGNLPEGCRAVYSLRDLEGASGEETARILGLSLAAAKSRLHRARLLVRRQLDEELMKGQN